MSVHGYQPYKPQDRTQIVLKAARNICIDYEAWNSPLTVRQIFYRLVAEYGYGKTEKNYGSLVGYVARSRRAFQHAVMERAFEIGEEEAIEEVLQNEHTLIPFSWIRDERGASRPDYHFFGEQDFLRDAKKRAENMKLDRLDGQPRNIELWCEAAGMVPLMVEIASPYGIRVSSGGGYDSVTAKHKLAQRVDSEWRSEGRNTLVLHIGDFDPSGEGMYETLSDDVGEMAWQAVGDNALEVKRIALREDQVLSMGIETAPPKPMDSRRRGFIANHPVIRERLGSNDITAQLEALAPPDLRSLVQSEIQAEIDDETYRDVLAKEERVRESLLERLDTTKEE